jgi:hypothetical protein
VFANFLRELYAYLSVLPFLVFAVVYGVHYFWKRNFRRAFTVSIDVTMVFLFGAVAGLLDLLLGFRYSIWLLILAFLIAFGLIGNVQHRMRGRLDAARALRIVWRIGFFVLSVLYILLLLIGIVKYWLR